MNKLEWIEYPENSPVQSGVYVVNRDVNNSVSNTLAYYDTGIERWYENQNEMIPLAGVNAFYEKRILPLMNK